MRVTIDGWRLAPSVGIGAVHSGAKSTIKVSKSPEIIWNGNPYCEPSCVLYLPGYPGAGATIRDFSGEGNHGTINGAIWVREPSGLWVLSFVADANVVDCGNDSSLDLTTDFAIEVWEQIDDTSTSRVTFGKGSVAGNRGYIAPQVNAADKLYGDFGDAAGNWGLNWITTHTFTDFVNYHHIVMTRDGGTVYAYVNGVEVDNTAYATAIKVNTVNLAYGANNIILPTGTTFDGKLALPRIYSRAMDAPEVLSHYNQERHLFGV